MQIAHHLSELWKKQKGVLFYETPCTITSSLTYTFRKDLLLHSHDNLSDWENHM